MKQITTMRTTFEIGGQPLKELHNRLEIFKNFSTEIRFWISEHGLKVVEMDPANVCLITFTVKAQEFLEFHPGSAKAFTVNANDLTRILKPGKDSKASLEISGDKLNIEIDGQNHGIHLIEDDKDEPTKIPQLDAQNTHEIKDLKGLKAYIKKNPGSSIVMSSSKEKLILNSEDDNGNTSSYDPKAKTLRESGEKKSKFSLEYLSKFFQKLNEKTTDKLLLDIGTDYPLTATISGTIKLTWILAPRVGDE